MNKNYNYFTLRILQLRQQLYVEDLRCDGNFYISPSDKFWKQFWNANDYNASCAVLCHSLYPIIMSHHVPSCPIVSHRVPSCPIVSHRVPSCSIVSHRVPSYPIVSHHVPSCPIMFHRVPLCPIMSHRVLSCPIMSHPVLPHIKVHRNGSQHSYGLLYIHNHAILHV